MTTFGAGATASAIAASRSQGFPDVYVFRYPEPPSVKLEDPERAAIEAHLPVLG